MNNEYTVNANSTAPTTHPNIPIRPPFVLYAGLFAGWAIGYVLDAAPLCPLAVPTRLLLGTFPLLLGIFIMSSALSAFKRIGTNVRTDFPVNGFTTAAIYRFTRNPMYLSFCIIGFGIALYINQWWAVAGIAPFFLYTQFFVIPREERFMSEKFGENYSAYCKTTRRWI